MWLNDRKTKKKNIKILHRGWISFMSFIISDPDVLLAHIGGWICLICMRESSSTWACFIRLIFVISTVIGSITKPPFGYAAIIGTLELVNRATVVSWKEQQKQKNQHMSNRKCFVLKKYILYLRMLQRIFQAWYIFLFYIFFFLLTCFFMLLTACSTYKWVHKHNTLLLFWHSSFHSAIHLFSWASFTFISKICVCPQAFEFI